MLYTAGNFALVSARNGHDDDQRSFFCVGVTLFQKPRGADLNMRGRGTTVALSLRTAEHSLFRGVISTDYNRNYSLKLFKTSS